MLRLTGFLFFMVIKGAAAQVPAHGTREGSEPATATNDEAADTACAVTDDRYAYVNRTCLGDFARYQSCVLRKDPAYYPQLPVLDDINTSVNWVVEVVIPEVFAIAGDLNPLQNSCEKNRQRHGERELLKTIALANKFISGHKLSECQIACVAKCITSTALEYDEEAVWYDENGKIQVDLLKATRTKMQSLRQMCNGGKAVCSNFTKFGNYVLDALKGAPKSDFTGSMQIHHSVVRVKINGQGYYADFIKPDCDFVRH